jgi:hypothetical protein
MKIFIKPFIGLSAIITSVIGLSSFVTTDEGSGGYFCKNDPSQNTGRCYVWATGASCDNTIANKDCYGIGQD